MKKQYFENASTFEMNQAVTKLVIELSEHYENNKFTSKEYKEKIQMILELERRLKIDINYHDEVEGLIIKQSPPKFRRY
jgi:hypothetical protein